MRHRVFRWDLDKTYLVSDFGSLRKLVRVPFEKGHDKVAVAGVAVFMRVLRKVSLLRGDTVGVYFLTASPPQIGRAVRDKLALDGVEYDGIAFKDQMRHLVRGQFDMLREQIGYKMLNLLRGSQEVPGGSREILFGDDWESDPFVYSLYADILAARVGAGQVLEVLGSVGVGSHYLREIGGLLERPSRTGQVEAICILRQRPVAGAELLRFGPRLLCFDNYFECCLRFYAAALVDAGGVVAVARAMGARPEVLADSFKSVASGLRLGAAVLAPLTDPLQAEGLMAEVPTVGRAARLLALPARRLARYSRGPFRFGPAGALPDYALLAPVWSRRGRRDERDKRDEKDGNDGNHE
ncbi:MAG: hypothetical protein VCA74_01590 [Deltaproteobacteria bacterium]